MKTNRIGKSDLFVREIGLGCMSLPASERDATSLIHQALELGVNFFDTADLYGQGQNEELLGKSLKGRRNDVVLATKVGNRWETGEPSWRWDPSAAYIKEAVQASLRRLNTDYIDLYQLHGGTLEDDFEETVRTFEDLKQAGWIRAYGISSIRPNVIRRFVEHSNIVSVMMQYSILDRRPEEEILDLLLTNQISVIARGPVAGGLLSNDIQTRVKAQGYLDYSKDELLQLSQSLHTFANADRSTAQVALRYVLAHPTVAVAVPGASRLTQLEHNLAATQTQPLSPDELRMIQNLSKANQYTQHR